MATVLLIDDEESLRKLLARVVELEGYVVLQAANAREGLKLLSRENIQVVVLDVKLPDGNGIELTDKIKKEHPDVEIIVLTAYGTIQDGVKAIKAGAFDYLTKGEHQEKIIPLLSKTSEMAGLHQKVRRLEGNLQQRFGFGSILGDSSLIKQTLALARKVAATDSTVLLLGETGTGKEVFAQAIHYETTRKSKPFVALNCSAFPKELIESELFGHTEGAFTGATKSKKGYLEESNQGTLFLDEIGELNVDLQAKLLRVLESGEFYPVGESKPRQIHVRFIAATNRNIVSESESGNFRKDLYYRLSPFTISLPPLRERKDDIPILARHFITQFSLKTNKREPKVAPEFLEALQKHVWRGNIRELKNVIERCIILADDQLTRSLLPPDFNLEEPQNSFALADAEQRHILKVLQHTGGNKTETARLLGIGLSTLYRKIQEYSL